ncbi:uncharacterized protein LOC121783403 isoform X2 [Salvia splendens]|uniref:uncharacterized protein LOC121783403 isoform X2 n=1 Tax=Salvia splendens TaxID=180675 RepID=UPI001C278F6E|nr:uncharacterized protein LOC121783403 isoform X2 [Salvia splendens]
MSIPVELLDEGCFRVGSQIGRKLLGIPEEEEVGVDEITTTLTQAREDEEEYSPEWIDEMEKMMAAYDKKKTITTSFKRPSFVLDGFECPDPFGTQQTQEACVSIGGVQAPKPDGRASFALDVDQPVNEEYQGGAAMSPPVGDVAGLEVPTDVLTSVAATHMEMVGGVCIHARASETGGVREMVHKPREITKGGIAKVGRTRAAKAKQNVEGAQKRAKKHPQPKQTGIIIGGEGTGAICGEVPILAAVVRGKGKLKEVQTEGAGIGVTNIETARVKKASSALRSPFNERAVRITTKANSNDKELYFWALSTTETHENIWDAIVYADNYKQTVQSEFLSLAPFKAVNPVIIDT